MTIIEPIRGQIGLRVWERGHRDPLWAYGLHACRFARGSEWGGKEVVDSEACGLFAGGIGSESETWCERGLAGKEGKKGPLAGRGGRESNERLKPTYIK